MRRLKWLTCSLGIGLGLGGIAPSASANFESCIERLKINAIKSGIDTKTVHSILDGVESLPRVIRADRDQPEFTQTFTQYYKRRVTPFRVDKGRTLLHEHADLLAQIEAETGIPPHYLVALWGLETNFGTYFGKLSIPSALATLACDNRRSAFFERELMATLTIIANGDIRAEDMIGSWAGAIGHMQFMPTTFLQHAKDGDGDGRRDLVGSIDDALTSGGHFVRQLGWQTGYRWGREVTLPDDFDYARSGFDDWQPLSYWRALGVTNTFGQLVPALELPAALLLPTGHQGPAFLVYENFRVIMGWNLSQHYALSVGRLADRIAGAGVLVRPLPKAEDIRFSTQDIVQLQANLNTLGYNAGKPDRIIGPATRKAIRAFQKASGLIADGYPNADVITNVNKQVSGRS